MSDLSGFLLLLWCVAAWLTHIAVCFADESWGFLIAGAVAFPVAWAHGTWVWLT